MTRYTCVTVTRLFLQCCRWDWSKWGLLVTQLVETHHHNISVVNEDGDTPLHIAARFNNEGAAEYLLKLMISDVNARNNVGLTAFDIAYQKQHQEVLRVLVECDEIFANIPTINVCLISQSDEHIHRITDAMSPSVGKTFLNDFDRTCMHACITSCSQMNPPVLKKMVEIQQLMHLQWMLPIPAYYVG